jgi:hypothetical protein
MLALSVTLPDMLKLLVAACLLEAAAFHPQPQHAAMQSRSWTRRTVWILKTLCQAQPLQRRQQQPPPQQQTPCFIPLLPLPKAAAVAATAAAAAAGGQEALGATSMSLPPVTAVSLTASRSTPSPSCGPLQLRPVADAGQPGGTGSTQAPNRHSIWCSKSQCTRCQQHQARRRHLVHQQQQRQQPSIRVPGLQAAAGWRWECRLAA